MQEKTPGLFSTSAEFHQCHWEYDSGRTFLSFWAEIKLRVYMWEACARLLSQMPGPLQLVFMKRVRDTVQRTGYKHTLHATGPDPIPWHGRAPLNLASCVPKQTYINHEMMVFDCSGVQVVFPGECTTIHDSWSWLNRYLKRWHWRCYVCSSSSM